MSTRWLRLCLTGALFAAVPALAADYLWMRASGAPRTWAGRVVTYNADLGPLGRLDNAAARERVRAGFATWAAVPTSTLRDLREGAQLASDVTAGNFRNLYSRCDDGVSPIIFDDDGAIIDEILGSGARNRTLGVGFPNCIDRNGDITEGAVVFNGRFLDGVDEPGNPEYGPDEFQNVIVHEIGHLLNLAHTQAGLDLAFDNDPTNTGLVPGMFPIIVRPASFELQLDDVAAISALYPSDDFLRSHASTARATTMAPANCAPCV